MSHYQTTRQRPVEETVKDKYDVLEWSSIPDTPCDLNYRPPFSITLWEQITPLLLLGLAAGVSILVASVLGTCVAPLLACWQLGCGCVLLGLVIAVAHLLISPSSDDFCEASFRTLLYLCTPSFIWTAIVLTAGLTNPALALLYLAVAIPMAVLVADRISTHAVYWMTANMDVDHTVLASWREDWARRFTSEPHLLAPIEELQSEHARAVAAAVVQARSSYPYGFIWLLAAFVVPLLFVLAASTRYTWSTIGLQIVFGGFCGLMLAALVRCQCEFRTVRRCWSMFLHWFHFGKARRMPPWMFRSPCGSHVRRRWLSAVAVGMISVVFTYLAAHSVSNMALIFGHDLASVPGVEHEVGPHQVPPRNDYREMISALWGIFRPFLLVSLLAFILPVLAHLLMIVVLLGPLIQSYYEALEA